MPGSGPPEEGASADAAETTIGPEGGGDPAPPAGDGGPAAGEGPSAEDVIGRLEAGVEALLAEVAALRERARRAEEAQRRVAEALEGSDVEDVDAGTLQERLAGLAEENRHLRDVLTRARGRAERIRTRLMVVEDET